MDTGTHVVMGIALGALATVDPVVAGSSQAAIGIMTATIIGSQIPDIDTVLKLKTTLIILEITEESRIPCRCLPFGHYLFHLFCIYFSQQPHLFIYCYGRLSRWDYTFCRYF